MVWHYLLHSNAHPGQVARETVNVNLQYKGCQLFQQFVDSEPEIRDLHSL